MAAPVAPPEAEAARAAADGQQGPGSRRARRRLVAALVGAAVLADVGVLTAAVVAPASAPHAVEATAHPRHDLRLTAAEKAARGAADGFQDPARSHPKATSSGVPTRIDIPAIGVDAAMQRLSRNPAGVLQPPDNWTDAGWYADGVLPGAVGPAVIAGHLDTTKRAAVFVNLRLLRPGNRIRLHTSKGRTLTFVVTHSQVVRKALFPTSTVYGPTPDAELRLITCSEPFDATEGVYADNLVVFAVLEA